MTTWLLQLCKFNTIGFLKFSCNATNNTIDIVMLDQVIVHGDYH